MILDARHIILTLRGSPDEFANTVAGFPDYDNIEDLKSALGHVAEGSGVVVMCSRVPWELGGTWKAFAELIGYPEANTLEDFLDAFQEMHSSVHIERR